MNASVVCEDFSVHFVQMCYGCFLWFSHCKRIIIKRLRGGSQTQVFDIEAAAVLHPDPTSAVCNTQPSVRGLGVMSQ